MTNARLLISDLRYAYVSDGGKAVEALAKVDIALQPNDFVSLIGPSGCGKSTLFNVIAGLLIPDAGAVKLDGADIIGRPGNVAYMMQRDLLLPWRTVLENVTLGPEIAGKSMVNAVPFPGVLSTVSLPSCASMIRFAVGSPSPLPPDRVEKNG